MAEAATFFGENRFYPLETVVRTRIRGSTRRTRRSRFSCRRAPCEAAWQALLEELVRCGFAAPELAVVDGVPGLEKLLATVCSNIQLRIRTSNAIERLHGELERGIETQTVLLSAETEGILASDRITMRKADGWQSRNPTVRTAE
jgi:transposase-like protein